MFPFDVILFDIGGVLLTNGWDHCERAVVLDQFHLDKEEFEKRHPGPNDAWERDVISAEGYLDETVFYEPRSFSHEDFLEAIFRAIGGTARTARLGILQELAASGKYMLGCLNNEAREPNEYRFREFGLRQLFRYRSQFLLCGLAQTESAHLSAALSTFSERPPQRILFIDDRPENAGGGRSRRNESQLGLTVQSACAAISNI